MILLLLILIPLVAGVVAWPLKRNARMVALVSLLLEALLACAIWPVTPPSLIGAENRPMELVWDWIPQFGISFHLAIDGLSLLFILLTVLTGIIAVAASWKAVSDREGFFYFNLLGATAVMIALFLAVDLFLFYILWELMLVPMLFLIALWGSGKARQAAVKFLIFTVVSGLFMLIGLLVFFFNQGHATGVYTFDYGTLVGYNRSGFWWWAMLGFFLAFAVKLGIVPFHGWLPDAYACAPAGGSILLAGIMSKTGAYGMLRFMIPLFPAEFGSFSTVAMVLGVISILYGAALAFAQSDLKRLLAYSSISHMGFVLLGIGAWHAPALEGTMVQLLSHGVMIGALFLLAGSLYERIGSTDTARMGGLWGTAPRMGMVTMLFALAAMALPGLGSFVGEFLTLLGTFPRSVAIAAAAASGSILSVIYALSMVKRIFQGPNRNALHFADLSGREAAALAVLAVAIIWLGLYPQPFFAKSAPSLQMLPAPVATEQGHTPGGNP